MTLPSNRLRALARQVRYYRTCYLPAELADEWLLELQELADELEPHAVVSSDCETAAEASSPVEVLELELFVLLRRMSREELARLAAAAVRVAPGHAGALAAEIREQLAAAPT